MLRAAILISILVSASASTAIAIDFPYRQKGEQEIDKHQIGYGDIVLTSDGVMKIHNMFSNGKKVAGNNFYGITYIHDINNAVIGYFVQWRGVNAAGTGGSVEGHVEGKHQLTPDQLARFHHVSFRFGAKNCGLRVTGWQLRDKGFDIVMNESVCQGTP